MGSCFISHICCFIQKKKNLSAFVYACPLCDLISLLCCLWRNFGPTIFAKLLPFIEVCRHLFMHISPNVPPQHFRGSVIWISTMNIITVDWICYHFSNHGMFRHLCEFIGCRLWEWLANMFSICDWTVCEQLFNTRLMWSTSHFWWDCCQCIFFWNM